MYDYSAITRMLQTNTNRLLALVAFAEINKDLLVAIIISAAEKQKTKREWYFQVKEENPDMDFNSESLFVEVIDFIYEFVEFEDLKYYN